MRYGLLMKSKNDELFIFDEPTNYMKSIYDIDSKKWLETMKSKMNFMYTSHIWNLVDPLKEVKPIGYKWIFKIKINMDDNYKWTKARLVTKGYKQEQISWLWWNLLPNNYIKNYKDFACYSYILWLWDLINVCQKYIPEWKSSRRCLCDTTWKFLSKEFANKICKL